jgi:hypothetical protein
MRELVLRAIGSYDAIILGASRRHPQPTVIGCSAVDLRPKPVRERGADEPKRRIQWLTTSSPRVVRAAETNRLYELFAAPHRTQLRGSLIGSHRRSLKAAIGQARLTRGGVSLAATVAL